MGWVWGRRDFQDRILGVKVPRLRDTLTRGIRKAESGIRKAALLRSVSVNLAELRRAPAAGDFGVNVATFADLA